MRAVISLFAATCLITACSFGRQTQQVVIATDTRLGDAWVTLRPSRNLAATGLRSEVLIAVYPSHTRADGAAVERPEERLCEIELMSTSGTSVRLDDQHLVSFNARLFLNASTSALLRVSGRPEPQFDEVRIRCTPPLNRTTIYWLSYNPEDFKDGVAFPPEE
jgi:hypothetical protein